MARANDTRPASNRGDLDREAFLEMQQMDDEMAFDEFDNIEAMADAGSNARRPIPLWRLIEMYNEDRELRRETADFAGYYDDFEDAADQNHGRTSH